ncbi:hypothetical protein C0J52_24070 [Blattella germanica]|nr:hypothetical protein C0J52_24070 [Blattella germanica]
MELIDSKVDRIFARELPHEVGTLITSEDPSKNSVSDCMMKESKGDEDKATLPSSELSNGQIKQTETLNGVLPKECPNSKVPLEMSESKLSVPLEFSYSFSSSDENLSINKDLAENGIPIESSFDTEGNYVFSEDRTNSVFEFEDSEKFGLSDSEVDKLLKDVDGKEKSDSSKRTKTNEEKENGHTNEKEGKFNNNIVLYMSPMLRQLYN